MKIPEINNDLYNAITYYLKKGISDKKILNLMDHNIALFSRKKILKTVKAKTTSF